MIIESLLGLRSTSSNPAQSLIDWVGGGEQTSSGLRVSVNTAMTYAAFWRGVNKIARDVAKLPFFVYRRRGESERLRQGGHPATRLLRRRPNDYMTAFTFRQAMQAHALCWGFGAAAINRDAGGRAESLTLLQPQKTRVVVDGRSLYYLTRIPDGRGGEREIPLEPDDVFLIKGLSPDGITPYSVIRLARESLGLGLAARKYGAKFFGNSARLSVILEHPSRLSEKAGRNMAKSFARLHSGLDNQHGVAVTEEGVKVTPVSMSNEDAQFLETRQFELREIACWLGLPSHFLGDTTRTSYSSLEQENQSYLDDTLDGWLCTWEAECHRKLLTVAEQRSGQYICEFTRNALVRADLKSRYEAYAIGINTRILSPNEVRAKENLNPYDGGDEFLVPLNIQQGRPGGQDNSRTAALLTLEDAAARLITRIGHAAQRAAKRDAVLHSVTEAAHARPRGPENFVTWLDGMEERHGALATEILRRPLEAVRTAGQIESEPEAYLQQGVERLFELVRAGWLDLAGQVRSAELPSRLEDVIRGQAKVLPGQFAAMV